MGKGEMMTGVRYLWLLEDELERRHWRSMAATILAGISPLPQGQDCDQVIPGEAADHRHHIAWKLP